MVNVLAMIREQKAKFRQRNLDKVQIETTKLAEENKYKAALAKEQRIALKSQKTEEQYRKSNPSLLQRLGKGLAAQANKGKKASALKTGQNLARVNQGATGLQFGGTSGPNMGTSPFQFGGSGTSPFNETSKRKKL